MKAMGWLLVSLAALAARGQGGSFPETDKLRELLMEADRHPAAVEYRKVADEIRIIREKRDSEAQGLHSRLEDIRKSEGYQEYQRRRQELEDRLAESWDAERRDLITSSKEIYAARHAEIQAIARADLPGVRRLGLNALNYPRVDGSTSSEPLSVILACRVLGVPYEWVYPEPRGQPWMNQPDVSEFLLPRAAASLGYDRSDYEFLLATLRVVAKPARKEQQRVAMMINSLLAASTSTHDAYVNLIEGRSDLNLAARPPSESELKLAKEKGVTICLEPVARDAFVLLVHRKNPLPGLTRRQVRDIYEEKIRDWQEVGGSAGPITAFRRERDSGSRELFDALVMEGRPLADEEGHDRLYSDSMGGPFSQLTQDVNGLGYSIHYYEHFMAASPFTRTVAIDGVEPNAETIAAGKYPWVTQVLVAYRDGEPEGSPGMKLVRWLLTPEGQGVVRESGYVPVK
jgi:phosphate transport system substrate-binding protein